MAISKPTGKTNWGVGNPDFATNVIEPSAGKKQTAWQSAEKPAYEWMNWLFYITDQWVDHFEDPSGQILEIDNGDSPYSAVSLNRWLAVDTSAGAVTINLPPVVGNEGVQFMFVKSTSDSNDITIDGDGGETINGALTAILSSQFESIILKEINGEWAILAKNSSTEKTETISSNTTLTSNDLGKNYFVDTSGGAINVTLPAAVAGGIFSFKDSTGSFEASNVTIVRDGSESIEGLASDYVLEADFGTWKFISNGTNWFIV